jgi:hypothetical protein
LASSVEMRGLSPKGSVNPRRPEMSRRRDGLRLRAGGLGNAPSQPKHCRGLFLLSQGAAASACATCLSGLSGGSASTQLKSRPRCPKLLIPSRFNSVAASANLIVKLTPVWSSKDSRCLKLISARITRPDVPDASLVHVLGPRGSYYGRTALGAKVKWPSGSAIDAKYAL